MPLIYNPRQTVLITCRGHAQIVGKKSEREDIVPCNWHSPASQEPPMYAIFLPKSNTHPIELIRSSQAFVVNFIPFELRHAAVFCGRHTGEHLDKFTEAGLGKIEAQKIDAPVIKEAVGWIECEVSIDQEVGDHVLFIGKAMQSEFKLKDAKRPFHIEGDRFTTTKD